MHNDPASPRRLPHPPDVAFGPDGVPQSVAFGDVYFSRAGGFAESEAVFLAGCGLPDGWARRQRYTIGELGFGTGLNALAAWRAWRRTRASGALLHFVSFEAHPLDRDAAGHALALFPEVEDLAARLLARWPWPVFGPQRLWFPEDGFCLTLHIGDAEAALARLQDRCDAWFLDGFSPARNPQLWSPSLLARVAALSAPGARVATYAAAGHVRRTLQAVGYAVARKPGFGAKRERLEAVAPDAPPLETARPSVAIIGAGIAGAHIAAAFLRRGLTPLVLDAADAPGAGASGNPAVLLMPRLDRSDDGAARFYRAAYLFALDLYGGLGDAVFTPLGVLEAAKPGREAAMADLLANPPLPGALLQPHPDGAWHPRAGIIKPHACLEALLRGAIVRPASPVSEIVAEGGGLRLQDEVGLEIASAAVVVAAGGAGAGRLVPGLLSPVLTLSRGQVEWGHHVAPPRHAIAGGPYVAPFADGVLFGATFDPAVDGADATPDDASRNANLAALAGLSAPIAEALDPRRLSSRAALRATTPDRLPISGAVPDGPPGLYLCTGLGARGFLTAPILAESLAALILGEPQPLDSASLAAINPGRFANRARRKQPARKAATEEGAP